MPNTIDGTTSAIEVIAYIVSGIGFLGAGVIMKDSGNISGLNTAATLWCSAAIGACAGSDMIAEAALLTGFILIANTLLRRVVRWLDQRIPLSAPETDNDHD